MSQQQHRRKSVRLNQPVYAQPGTVALLTACCASRRHIFAQPKRADLAITEIGLLHGENWRVLGFCIMPDHIHLLVLNVEGSILDFMRLLKGRIAKHLRGDVAGNLWQRSFHDHLLRRNEDINRTLQYMLENPVRANLVTDWTEYPWCGSFQWPELDPELFEVKPENILWNEIFQVVTEATGSE